MDVVVWLRSLGLGKYEAAFRENEITEKVLPNLTAEDASAIAAECAHVRRRAPGVTVCAQEKPSRAYPKLNHT